MWRRDEEYRTKESQNSGNKPQTEHTDTVAF